MKVLPMYFYQQPHSASEVMKTKEYQELLLNNQSGFIFAIGRCWEIIGKKCGPGLYRVSLKEKS